MFLKLLSFNSDNADAVPCCNLYFRSLIRTSDIYNPITYFNPNINWQPTHIYHSNNSESTYSILLHILSPTALCTCFIYICQLPKGNWCMFANYKCHCKEQTAKIHIFKHTTMLTSTACISICAYFIYFLQLSTYTLHKLLGWLKSKWRWMTKPKCICKGSHDITTPTLQHYQTHELSDP